MLLVAGAALFVMMHSNSADTANDGRENFVLVPSEQASSSTTIVGAPPAASTTNATVSAAAHTPKN